VQVKVEFEYYHDKLYEPSLKTTKRSFYVGKIINRSNLVQSSGELRSAMENQIKEILVMMDNFENQGSNWVIVRPLQFKVRFIRFSERFRRAKGHIKTPVWLHDKKAIINMENEDDLCFFKCIWRYFNRDKHRHDYKDEKDLKVINTFFEEAGIDLSMFNDGITQESVRQFELTNKIGINIFYIDKRGPEHCRLDYISVYNDIIHEPMIDLGYLVEGDICHFVIVTKPNCIISNKYRSHKTLVCALCYSVFSKREALLNHELSYLNLTRPSSTLTLQEPRTSRRLFGTRSFVTLTSRHRLS
jgi:hypothetical protein